MLQNQQKREEEKEEKLGTQIKIKVVSESTVMNIVVSIAII